MYDELVMELRNMFRAYKATDNGNCRHAKTILQAADAIEELSKSRWIPVTERLPETGIDVLVMFPHNMAVASRDMGEWVVNSGDGWCTDVSLSDDEKEPTHWMPLPEPPKEV